MSSLTKRQIAEIVVGSLNSNVESHGNLADNPFVLKVKGLVPLAVFGFTVTAPPGGRHRSELKIQLIAPGQKRGEPGSFVAPPGHWPVLLGFSENYNVFVLWDARKHVDFAWSKNCQVKMQALTDAQITGHGTATRNLRGGVTETILTARPDHLLEVLGTRVTTA